MAEHRTRIGLHARNDWRYPEPDYALVRQAKIETLKTMSFTQVEVYERLKKENPNLEFIVRLYDDRIGQNSRPSPADFCAKMIPVIKRLQPYAEKFEIHNEPNHVERIEGWGASDDNAHAFRVWYQQVLSTLKQNCPGAKFGFPGLALNHPHRDLAWLDICRDVIQASDWLGCHTYWQYGNMLNDQWGLRFKLYHDRFPNKKIEITEFGNSTPNLPREEIAKQYVRYYEELNNYAYLGSASAFIASSPDPTWSLFVWMKEGGEMLPVVQGVANMVRKPIDVTPAPTPPPEPTPPPQPPEPTERTFPETGKTVRGKFLEFFNQYGLDICGYPITDQFEEYGFQSQYFQRLAMEQVAAGQIRLKLAGTEAWTSRPKIAGLEARVKELEELGPVGGPDKPPIEEIIDDLPKHASIQYPTRTLAEIDRFVIHHTATPPTITALRLAQYQVQTLGKAGIVYHFCIAADGTIYQTNTLETVSDHAYSQNQGSVGICFFGNFTKDIPTGAQLEAGARLCAWLLGSLRLPSSAIVGIGEFVNTQSPGRQWLKGQRWKDLLLERVKAALETGGEDQSALIASLKERIEALEKEIEELKQAPAPTPPPTPAPPPGPVQIARPPIQDLVDKLPKHGTNQYKNRPADQIRALVVHHSAVPPTVGPKQIASYHVNKLDWPGVGYHFMVSEDGIIYQGNTLQTLSYHAVKANPYSVGICFLGNFTKLVPPPAQLRAGAHLIAWLMQELDIPLDEIVGHKEVMGTACPGAQWLKEKKWKQMLRQEIAKVQEETGQPIPTPPPSGDKPIYHYMLFWAQNGKWAQQDWLNAQAYIGAFRPTAGFSADDASQAEHVTIVGGPLGVSKEVENRLKTAGCHVDRIEGKDEADTKKKLDTLAKQGKRFQDLDA